MKATILHLLAALAAMCLWAGAASAQSNLKIRVHVPFSFTVENTTFDAGDYVVTEPSTRVLRIQSQSDHTSVFQNVQSAHSRAESDGHGKFVFHRYGSQYFLAVVSDGTLESTFDFQVSGRERQVAAANPQPELKIVSVLANGSTMTTVFPQ